MFIKANLSPKSEKEITNMSKNQNKIALGIIGEMVAFALLSGLFKTKEGFKVKHIDWKRYNCGFRVDLRVFKKCKSVMDIEVKNWRLFSKPYGTEIAISEIIDRFKKSCALFKILFITYKTLLTREALGLLDLHKIHVFEIGKLMGKKDFKNKFFYETKQRLAQFIKTIKSKANKQPEIDFGSYKLDNYLELDNIDNSNTIVDNSINNNDTQLPEIYRKNIENIEKKDFKPKNWKLLDDFG